MYHCYVLIERHHGHYVYTGHTNNLTRRLKQHNGLVSGARYTRGREWDYLFCVSGFQTRSQAAKFERDMKKRYVPRGFLSCSTLSGGNNNNKGLVGRLRQLEYLLDRHKNTPDLLVQCCMTKQTYLDHLGISLSAFAALREDQPHLFLFEE